MFLSLFRFFRRDHVTTPTSLSRLLKARLDVEPLEQRTLLDAGLFRTIDGSDNNLAHPEWGSTNEQLLRVAPSDYSDDVSSPAGANRPSAREVSNALAAQDVSSPSDRDLTAFVYLWGQFLDHDLDLTGTAEPKEAFNIAVPTGDSYFDPNSTGSQIIPLSRSIYDQATGTSSADPREQISQVTAWIDGSMIYGSSEEVAASLRTFEGGKLRVTETNVGNLLPQNEDGSYLAGDIRVNENIELTSMHTLFLREHNRIAGDISRKNPTLSDEQIYQQTRSKVIAEIQAITYNEWLPALIGRGVLSPYQGYNSTVNPTIANEFSTAGFRLHTTINDDVEFFDNQGRQISFTYVNSQGQQVKVDGEISLSEAFFNPTLFGQTGVDGILKYSASTHAQEIDTQIVDSLRNFLFGQPGQGGLDLAALNIQRGRDHGLADYNTTREAYGLSRVTSFAEITSNQEIQQTLKSLYGSVDNIDLWVGVMSEDHVAGSSTGQLMQRILVDQFERLRDGDRFWYEKVYSGQELKDLEKTSLSDIIKRNTGVQNLQNNVFFFKPQASGQVFLDRNTNGQLNRGETGVRGYTVQLLNNDGEVVSTTRTDAQGRFRFTDFNETGDYKVRVILPAGMRTTTQTTQAFLISNGDSNMNRLSFGVTQSRPTPPPPPRPRPVQSAATNGKTAQPVAPKPVVAQPAKTPSDRVFIDFANLMTMLSADKRKV